MIFNYSTRSISTGQSIVHFPFFSLGGKYISCLHIFHFFHIVLTKPTELSLFWVVVSLSAIQEFRNFFGTRRFTEVFARGHRSNGLHDISLQNVLWSEMSAPWRTQAGGPPLCRPCTTDYSMYLQLLSISGGRFHPQPEDEPCRDDRGPTFSTDFKQPYDEKWNWSRPFNLLETKRFLNTI
jgi:hypothetical protein